MTEQRLIDFIEFVRSKPCFSLDLLPPFRWIQVIATYHYLTPIPLAFSPIGPIFNSLKIQLCDNFGFFLIEKYINCGTVVSNAPRSVMQVCDYVAVFQYILLITTGDSLTIVKSWPAKHFLAHSGNPFMCANTGVGTTSFLIRSFSMAFRRVLSSSSSADDPPEVSSGASSADSRVKSTTLLAVGLACR